MKNTTQTKILHKIMLWVIIIVLTIQFVTALGIRPAKTTINSEEIKVYKGTIWVVNNDHQELTIGLGPGGEFGQYVKLSQKEITLRNDVDAVPVDFIIELPQELPPGNVNAHILVEERNSLLSDDGNVGAKISLKHKIIIQNGYPEKYIETKLNFHESGNTIRLVSEVENKGKKDIEKVKTTFYVNNKQNINEEQKNDETENNEQSNLLTETETTSIKTKENKLLEATIPKTLFTQGEFTVSAITTYDDQQIKMTKKILIGKPEIDITYFDKYFAANEINKYSLDLLNKWNTQIENVFVDIIVKKENKEIDQFRTKSVDLDAKTSKRISDYFDARNKNPGTYSFDMVVNFWDTYRMQTKTYKSELLSSKKLPPEEIKPAIEIPQNQNSPTGNAIADKIPSSNSFNPFMTKELWYALSGAILASLLFIIYRAGQKRGRDEFEELIQTTNQYTNYQNTTTQNTTNKYPNNQYSNMQTQNITNQNSTNQNINNQNTNNKQGNP